MTVHDVVSPYASTSSSPAVMAMLSVIVICFTGQILVDSDLHSCKILYISFTILPCMLLFIGNSFYFRNIFVFGCNIYI